MHFLIFKMDQLQICLLEIVILNWRHLVTNSFHEEFEIFLGRFCQAQGKVHQLDFIAAFLQAKVKKRVFLKLEIRYSYYFHNIQVNLEEP